jgi:competence protein ComEA
MLNLEPIKNWFGFTRRERRSSFLLLIILSVIIGIRYFVPEKNIEIKDFTAGFNSLSGFEESDTADLSAKVHPFPFNPNTASYDTLMRLGFAAKEARTIISYRNKGGKFRKPADIKKIYGIEQDKADKLIPFVEVEADTSGKAKFKPAPQKIITIEINSCDSSELVRLPGIGPVLSARIIKYRRLLGGFATTEQLREVYGLSGETFDLIRGRVSADTSLISRINVNTADYRALTRLIYFEKFEITSVLKYRELKGRINSVEELVENKIITGEKGDKVSPYLKFGEE